MPSKDNSYKGYGPPKCTYNVRSTFLINIPTKTCQFYMESYMSCHEMRCDSSCTMRLSPQCLSYTTPKPMCDKSSFRMTSNDHFQNNFFLFINQKIFGRYITMIILYSKSCSFLWVATFWCLTMGFANLDTFTVFHRWGLCLTIIGGFFTRGRIYPFLLIPDTYFLYHFDQPCDSVRRCPIYRAHPINTKHNVDLPTMHSHP